MHTRQLLGSNKHLQQPEIHTLIMQMTERETERERERERKKQNPKPAQSDSN